MALSKPTVAGTKSSNGNINYISASDGAGNFLWLLDKSSSANLVLAADNDTLSAGVNYYSEPALNVVHHLVSPTPTKDSFFTVANVGKGIIDIGGVQLLGNGVLEFVSSKAGDKWVLTSIDSTVLASSEKTSKTFTQTAHGLKIGQAVYHDGTKFVLADSTSDVKSDVVGVVSAVPDANTIEVCSEGYITGIVQSGLTAGAVFLGATAGVLVETAPTTGFFRPVLLLDSATSGWVLQRGAIEITSSATTTELMDAWLSSSNADHSKKGLISFSQVKAAIAEEYRYLNSGTWDANDSPKLLNQYISGSTGVSVSNFPNGLASPSAFISEFYGSDKGGVQRLTIFGLPTSTRGVWSRILKTDATWTPWQLESQNYFDFTPAPATEGETYTTSSGNVAINNGDILLLRESDLKSSARATPVTTWDKVGKIDLTASAKAAGWTIEGTQPTSGNAVIDLFTDNFAKKWVIRLPSAESTSFKNRETALATGGVIDQKDPGIVYALVDGGSYTVNSNVAIGETIEFSVPKNGTVTITDIGTVKNVGTGLQKYVYKKTAANTYVEYTQPPPKVDQRLSTFTVTTAYAAGEVIDLTTGNGATTGKATLAAAGQGSSVIDATHNIGATAAAFNTDNAFFVLVNGLPAVRGTDCIYDTVTSLHFTWPLITGDSFSIFRNEWL